VRERRDDVDGEADEERPHGGVDGPKEREDDGEEPDGHDDGEPGGGALAEAAAVVEADELLPDEVERRAGEAEGDELVDEHEHDGGVAEGRPREQRQRVGVRQQLVPERPVHARRRRQRQRQHVQRRHQVDRLELLRPPHRVHDLPAFQFKRRSGSHHPFSLQEAQRVDTAPWLFNFALSLSCTRGFGHPCHVFVRVPC